jgi:hypothetical protein
MVSFEGRIFVEKFMITATTYRVKTEYVKER